MGASFLIQCTGLLWGRGRVSEMGPVMRQITVQCAAQVPLSICFLPHPQSVLQAHGELSGAQVFVVQIKTSTGRLCHTNDVYCGESSYVQIRECAGRLHGNYLCKIWHHVPQKNTLLLCFLSLECFEVLEHRASYSKLLERNWRWLSLVLLDDCCVCCSGSWMLLFNITLGQWFAAF